jgi:hypothetical protein
MPDEYGRMDPLEAADDAMLQYAPDKYHRVNGHVYKKPDEKPDTNTEEKWCGYEEPIGVDIRAGVILEGAVTVICPKCGAITRQDNVRAIVPVRFIPPQKEQL